MKEYIVSEEELRKIVFKANKSDVLKDDIVRPFLKSKQPVEVLAEGEIYSIYKDSIIDIEGKEIFYGRYQLNNKEGNYVEISIPTHKYDYEDTIKILIVKE
jgi:hypothetical protein